MNNRFDVIIVGAGPAGLACAREVAGTQLRVLVVEKNDTIGPKICAGGLTGIAADFGVPEDQARTFHTHRVHLDGRPPIRIVLARPLKIVGRPALARHHLQKIAGASNIEIVTGTRLIRLNNGSVTTEKGDFKFRHLVAADGSQSIVRKHLGLPSKFGVGLYYEVPQAADEVIFHFRPKIIRSGYLWVFPHRDHTNIGVGFNPDTLTAGLAKVILQQYMKQKGFARDGSPLKGGVINHLYRGYRFGNIFLAGDAAGLASKASGEGISFALLSGREIGRKILDPGHDMKAFRRILSLKRRQEGYWRFFESMPQLQQMLLASYFSMMRFPWMQAYMGY